MSVHSSGKLLVLLVVLLAMTFLVLPASVQAQSAEIYVNDGSLDGDSWGISAVGDPTNSGTEPSSPVPTLKMALDTAAAAYDTYSQVTIKVGIGQFDGGYTLDDTYYDGSGRFRILGSDTTANDTTSILGNGMGDSVGFTVNGGTVSIKNLTVENFAGGGIGVTGNNFTLENVNVNDHGGTGVELESVSNARADSVSIFDNDDTGVVVQEGSRNLFTQMDVRRNGTGPGGNGFYVRDSTSGTYTNISIVNNNGVGLQFDTSTQNFVQNVTSRDNSGGGASSHGFALNFSDSNVLRNDTSINNGGHGVIVNDGKGDSIAGLTVTGNDLNGLGLQGGSQHRLNRIITDNNGQSGVGHGLLLSGADTSVIRNVTASNSEQSGFRIDGADSVTMKFNEARNNTEWAFEITSSSNGFYERNVVRGSNPKGIHFDDSDGLVFQRNQLKMAGGAITGRVLELDGSTDFDTFVYNNFTNLTGPPQVDNQTGSSIDLRYNYWGAPGEATVNGLILNVDFGDIIPFRLTEIDTGTSVPRERGAPTTPESFKADTSIAEQATFSWNQPSQLQGDLGSGFQIQRFHLYKDDTNTITNWKDEADTVFRIAGSDTQFTDTGIDATETFYYRITAFDTHERNSNEYESESYFSKTLAITSEDFGPEIYVNDGDTTGDVLTDRAGDNTKNGTTQYPLRTLPRAIEVSEPGDTIFLDGGTYTDTAVVDTGGVSIVGLDPDSTVLDGSAHDTPLLRTDHNADGTVEIRDLAVQNADTGLVLNGTDPTRLVNLRVRGGTTGIRVKGNASDTISNSLIADNVLGVRLSGDNNHLAQNQIDSNATYQVRVSGSNNTVRRNNIIPSVINSDSGVLTSATPDLTYNWWNATDSSVIQLRSDTTNYIPFRLGEVDTGVGADSIAPSINNVTIDTGTPQEITIAWEQPTDPDLKGYRVFRLKNTTDTSDWTQHEVARWETPGDTDYTDTDIDKKAGYSYRVTTFDNQDPVNESYFSEVLSGTWVNRDPAADSITTRTQVDSPVTVVLSGSDVDGDTLAYAIAEFPDAGTLDTTAIDVMEGIDTPVTYSPDTDAVGADSFVFQVKDGDGGTDTAAVTVRILVETSIEVLGFEVDGEDTPLVAGPADTFGARVLFENTKTGPGDVIRDTSSLVIRNSLGQVVSNSFDVRAPDTTVRVDGNDTSYGRWVVDHPAPGDTELLGNFTVSLNYDTNGLSVRNVLQGNEKNIDTPLQAQRTVNILPAPAKYRSGVVFDTAGAGVGTVDLDLGIPDNTDVIDTKTAGVTDGDSVFRMVQRGGTETIDTPIVNPRYRFASAEDFDTELAMALNDLRSLSDRDVDFNTRNLEVLSDDLLLISLWKNDTLGDSNQIDGPDYLGDSDVIRERSEVTVRNVQFSGKPGRLRVLKLRSEKDGGRWQWFQVDDLSDSGDVKGSDGNYTVRFEVAPEIGFSVFQIVVSGVVKDAPAEEAVVYPNPFVPHDGNPETGCYRGDCRRSGIHFGAGPDRGFSAGTDIKIYTIKGELVDEFSLFSGGILNWDARTRSGEPVASGVYIYRIETPDGSELNGKFAIVR